MLTKKIHRHRLSACSRWIFARKVKENRCEENPLAENPESVLCSSYHDRSFIVRGLKF